jgi:hypothetical protein
MKKRVRVNKGNSKRIFSKTASKVNPRNGLGGSNTLMRGGIRL